MDFPKDKMSFSPSHKARTSEHGWLVLHVGNMDLEGVNEIYIDLAEIDAIKARSEKQRSAADEVRRLFGG